MYITSTAVQVAQFFYFFVRAGVTLQSLPIAEYPTGDSVPVLQSLPRHVDVSTPWQSLPPSQAMSIPAVWCRRAAVVAVLAYREVETAWRLWHLTGRVVVKLRLQRWTSQADTVKDYAICVQKLTTKASCKSMPSTPQPSDYDRGVYAVAYATELALKNAPCLQAPFHTQQRRDHLARCLESWKLEQFHRDDTRQHGRDNARLLDSPMATRVPKCCSDCIL